MRIALGLGSEIVYAGGTVNGEEKTFVYQELTGQWTAEVDRAADDTYRLSLELVDEAGNHSSYSDTVVYVLPSFVFDRREEDIRNRTEKAYLNAADLNRIEQNTELIAGYLQVPAAVRHWKKGDLPRASDYRRIRDNVETIRAGYAIRADTPQTPAQPINTYQKWNDLERILYDVFRIYLDTVNHYNYCGEMTCGEEIGVM